MHLTLHLTARCNFRCGYCYAAPHEGGDMQSGTARAAVELAERLAEPGESVGIIFFGGEPLLKRALMEEVVEYAGERQRRGGPLFHFKMTTNGALLDAGFFTRRATREIFVAISHDGVREAHDRHRREAGGGPTYEQLRPKVELLLRYRPYAPVMMVVTPETVDYYAAGVRHLYESGFRYLVCSLNYGAAWERGALAALERQYGLLARWYEEETLKEEKFYFSPFDTKIASHVFPGSEKKERCELGRRQISVAPSGRLYPCVQFVGDGRESGWAIGDVWKGVRKRRRDELFEAATREQEPCTRCGMRARCRHTCGCLNRQATGSVERVSPVLCAHEQMTLRQADAVAERLWRRRSGMFVQRQYNELFPILSLTEDEGRRAGPGRPVGWEAR